VSVFRTLFRLFYIYLKTNELCLFLSF